MSALLQTCSLSVNTSLPLVCFSSLLSFLCGVGIGANDLSANFAMVVGSGSLNMRQAIIFCVVFELLGAAIMGGHVSNTIRRGIVNPELFEANRDLTVIGMTCASFSAALWLYLSTMFGLPVSITHTVIGSIMGYALVASGGLQYVKLGGMVVIVISWVAAPLAAFVVTAWMFYALQHYVLRVRKMAMQKTIRVIPYCLFVSLMVDYFFLIIERPPLITQYLAVFLPPSIQYAMLLLLIIVFCGCVKKWVVPSLVEEAQTVRTFVWESPSIRSVPPPPPLLMEGFVHPDGVAMDQYQSETLAPLPPPPVGLSISFRAPFQMSAHHLTGSFAGELGSEIFTGGAPLNMSGTLLNNSSFVLGRTTHHPGSGASSPYASSGGRRRGASPSVPGSLPNSPRANPSSNPPYYAGTTNVLVSQLASVSSSNLQKTFPAFTGKPNRTGVRFEASSVVSHHRFEHQPQACASFPGGAGSTTSNSRPPSLLGSGAVLLSANGSFTNRMTTRAVQGTGSGGEPSPPGSLPPLAPSASHPGGGSVVSCNSPVITTDALGAGSALGTPAPQGSRSPPAYGSVAERHAAERGGTAGEAGVFFPPRAVSAEKETTTPGGIAQPGGPPPLSYEDSEESSSMCYSSHSRSAQPPAGEESGSHEAPQQRRARHSVPNPHAVDSGASDSSIGDGRTAGLFMPQRRAEVPLDNCFDHGIARHGAKDEEVVLKRVMLARNHHHQPPLFTSDDVRSRLEPRTTTAHQLPGSNPPPVPLHQHTRSASPNPQTTPTTAASSGRGGERCGGHRPVQGGGYPAGVPCSGEGRLPPAERGFVYEGEAGNAFPESEPILPFEDGGYEDFEAMTSDEETWGLDHRVQPITFGAQRVKPFNPRAEYLFTGLQVVAGSMSSFVHGAVAGANATAAFVILYDAFAERVLGEPELSFRWSVGPAMFGLAIGASALGARLMKTVGVELVTLTPARGWAIQVGATLVTMILTGVGVPVSLSQSQIGAAVGCGVIDAGKRGVSWSLVAKIISGWVITLFISAATTGATFYVSSFFLC